jgi:hypothetical protein
LAKIAVSAANTADSSAQSCQEGKVSGLMYVPRQSFRDDPKDQTSDAQCASGNLEIPGSMLRIAPE